MKCEPLTEHLQETMLRKGLWLVTAESCTGGLLSSWVTDCPGSSGYFLGGVISYDNQVKLGVLGVQESTLIEHGAVSEPTALAMAAGVRRLLASAQHPIEKIVSVSITGIAGPGGATPTKPVGTVCIGLESHAAAESRTFQQDAHRLQNKLQFTRWALEMLVRHLDRL